jgi:hypothetical protein
MVAYILEEQEKAFFPTEIAEQFEILAEGGLVSNEQLKCLIIVIEQHKIPDPHPNWGDLDGSVTANVESTVQILTKLLEKEKLPTLSKTTMATIEGILHCWAGHQDGTIAIANTGFEANDMSVTTGQINDIKMDLRSERQAREVALNKKDIQQHTASYHYDGKMESAQGFINFITAEFNQRNLGHALKETSTPGHPRRYLTEAQNTYCLAFLVKECKGGDMETLTQNAQNADTNTVAFIDIYKTITYTQTDRTIEEEREMRDHLEERVDNLKKAKIDPTENAKSFALRIDREADNIKNLGGEFDDVNKIQTIMKATEGISIYSVGRAHLIPILNKSSYKEVVSALHNAGIQAAKTKEAEYAEKLKVQELKKGWENDKQADTARIRAVGAEQPRDSNKSRGPKSRVWAFPYPYPKYGDFDDLGKQVLLLSKEKQQAIQKEVETLPPRTHRYYFVVGEIWKQALGLANEKEGAMDEGKKKAKPWMNGTSK